MKDPFESLAENWLRDYENYIEESDRLRQSVSDLIEQARRLEREQGALITYADACTMLQVSHMTLRRWVREGLLSSVSLPRRLVRLRRAEVRALAEERKEKEG